MADVKWIKLATGLPDNRKIKQIRRLPDGDTIALMWIFLMCLAGETNDDGMVYFMPEIPYTDETLADQFGMDINTVRLGLITFQRFGMIEIIDDIICLPSWEKWQAVDKLTAMREKTRQRVAKHREKQKLTAGNVTCNVTVTRSNAVDIDKDIDRDIEEDIDSITVSKDTVCPTDVRRILEKWNALGVSQLKAINGGTKRYDMLKRRIKDYGVDVVVEAIERIHQSGFLLGQNKEGWVVTFDWFIKPNNFLKVLEGNYDKRHPAPQTMNTGGMKRGEVYGSDPGEIDDGRYGMVF